ncbi:MAG TPA: hypothetical protein VMX97_09660 [Hyphomicrobiaceae bacterium]|nr:hypothetical protein [Hyphomicrobiaceae bacterium]
MARYLHALVGLMCVLCSGPAMAGQWSTSYGSMTLPDAATSTELRAPYADDNGRIIGRMLQPKCPNCGVIVTGVWVETGSAKTCDSIKDGSRHWGNVDFKFNPEYTAFQGTWDYCGQGGKKSWTGKFGKGGVRRRGNK